MGKTLIISEKPSLAKNIVAAIGNMTWKVVNAKTHTGYYENDSYVVTNAFGHLFELQDAKQYNPEYEKWDLEVLPIVPTVFAYQIKNDAGVKAQYEVIRKLVNRSDVDAVVNAGDSDREGEIIIRNILNQIGNQKPVYRLWMPDQTPQTIRSELSAMKPDSDYDNLAREGYARTFIDWLYGINLTRLVTKKTDRFMRVGRVTSPIVTAICERERAIRNFKSEKYYIAVHDADGIRLVSKDKHSRKTDCEAQCQEYNRADTFVKSKTTARKSLPRPSLLSLSDLQGIAGRSLGFTPKKTLDVLQSLYEDGFASYPRTNSRYMATAEKGKAKTIIEAIQKAFPAEGAGISFRDAKAIFDDSKIESHSAVTPTYKIPDPAKMATDAAALYKIILKRFMAVFCTEDYAVDRTTLVIANGFENFTIVGDVVVTKGYTVYEKSAKKDSVLPPLNQGDRIQPSFVPEEKDTTPPDHYTAESLNNYLKNPYSRDEQKALAADDENKEVLGEVELGTEATRAGLIDSAIKSGYITLSQNRYGVTDLGEYYTDSLGWLGIDMTKERTLNLSKALKSVFRGKTEIVDVIADAEQDLRDICTQSKTVSASSAKPFAEKDPSRPNAKSPVEAFCKCPKCGSDIRKNDKAYSCLNKECTVVIFKTDHYFEHFQVKMTDAIAKALLTKQQVTINGLISPKTQKVFAAVIRVDFSEKYPKYSMEFPAKNQ